MRLFEGKAINKKMATLIGVISILLWSCLALLTTFTQGIPPFQLLAFSFGVAFILSIIFILITGQMKSSLWLQPWSVWITGFMGIFLYHALYFFSLKSAPAAEASLIAYLWPLLIVLFSGLLIDQRLRRHHLLGASLGLTGTIFLMLTRNTAEATITTNLIGYLAALGCALVWAIYSVVNQRFSGTSSMIMSGLCGLVSFAGFLCHALLEETVLPNTIQWIAIVSLGFGPVGLAFFAWDYATKHGNLPVLGALSYLAPLLSTFLLIMTGKANASFILVIAAILIIVGAIIATVPPNTTKEIWKSFRRNQDGPWHA